MVLSALMAPLLRLIAAAGALTVGEMMSARLTFRGVPLSSDDVFFLFDAARRHALVERFSGLASPFRDSADLEWELTAAGQREVDNPLTVLASLFVTARRVRSGSPNERYERLAAERHPGTWDEPA